jgi:hypothetical protein
MVKHHFKNIIKSTKKHGQPSSKHMDKKKVHLTTHNNTSSQNDTDECNARSTSKHKTHTETKTHTTARNNNKLKKTNDMQNKKNTANDIKITRTHNIIDDETHKRRKHTKRRHTHAIMY